MAKAKKSVVAPAETFDLGTPEPVTTVVETSAPLPTLSAPVFPPAAVGNISKTEAIRRALAAGIESPKAVVVWVKEQFGLDVVPTVVSTTKSLLAKKAGTSVHVASRRPTAVRPTAPVSGGGDTIQLVRSLKELVAQYGAAEVVKMTQVVTILSE